MIKEELNKLEETFHHRIRELLNSYSDEVPIIYDWLTQFLGSVGTELKETINQDGPCSDSFLDDIVSNEENTPLHFTENSDAPNGEMPYVPSCLNTSTLNLTIDVERQASVLSRRLSADDGIARRNQNTDDEEKRHQNHSQISSSGLRQNPSSSDRSTSTKKKLSSDSKDDGAGSIIPKLTKRKHPSNKGRGAKASKESKKRKLELIEQPAITNDTVPVREIRKYFAEHCQNPNNADFLARLYSAIGSQDAFLQLKNAAHHLRSNMVKIPFARTNSVVENMRSLDRLVSSFAASTIMERYLLVQLVDQRDALVEKHKPQQDRRLRMATENRSRLPRAEGLALVSMMDESYPMLDKSTEDYEIKLTTLRNRLSKGRNLHNLKEEFGREILALIPVDGTWQINDREIQRLADTDFRVFLDTLSRNRGEFLHACSARLSKFLEICNNPDQHGGYLLEELDEKEIKDTPHDSAVLISMLDRSPEKSAEKLA